ncbi:MAG: hypothetical protein RCG15_01475 [Candidatus Rickettsia vulgarisii]
MGNHQMFPEISHKLQLAKREYMLGSYNKAKDIVSSVLNKELRIAAGYDSMTKKEYGHLKLDILS